MVGVNIPSEDEENEAWRLVIPKADLALQPQSRPNSFWKGGSLCGLCTLSQSCVKYYVKVLLPGYYLDTLITTSSSCP